MDQRLVIYVGLLLAYAPSARAQPALEEVYKLTESGEWPHGKLDQILSISAPHDTSNPKRWVVERIRTDSEWCGARSPQGGCRQTDIRRHDWFDSGTCPALIPALDRLGQIPIPSFAGSGGVTSFSLSHAAVLSIEGSPRSSASGANPRFPFSTLARISIREQVGFFRQWWNKAEAALRPCWQDAAPIIAGKRIKTTLHAIP